MTIRCEECRAIVDPLEVFPGTLCLDCWAHSPEGRYVPTGAEVVAVWGGSAVRRVIDWGEE